MKLLAFDTTLETCSVAVTVDDELAAQRAQQIGRGHAEALMPMINDVLARARVGYDDLDGVAVTTGPGTFTGQRIGLAAARGIGLARQIPVQGVTTLDVIAFGLVADGLVAAAEDILVVLDARRGELYVQHFRQPVSWPQRTCSPVALPLADIGSLALPLPCVVVGTGLELAKPFLDEALPGRRYLTSPREADARHVAALAAREIASSGPPTTPPAPLYLRAPDAMLPGGLTP